MMKRLRRGSVTRFTKRWLLSGIVVMGVSWPVLAHADVGTLPAPQQTTQVTPPKQVATQPKAPTIAGREVYENGHWYFKDANDQPLSAWQNLSDQRLAYYHPTTKQMQYGEQNVAGQWYFLDQQNGDVKTGWYKLPDGRQVYYDVTKGDHQVSGRGILHGQQDVGQATYYSDDWNGAQVTGLKQVQGKTYYYAPAMVKNREAYANGHWRYFGADGTMQTGFVQLKDGRTVYYNGAGEMRYGEQAINHRWYYFDPVNGAMKRGWFTLPDKRKVYYDLQANAQGRGMLHGQQQLGDQIYYFNDWNGALRTNYAHYLAKVGKLQYYGSDGKLARRQVVRAGGGSTKPTSWVT